MERLHWIAERPVPRVAFRTNVGFNLEREKTSMKAMILGVGFLLPALVVASGSTSQSREVAGEHISMAAYNRGAIRSSMADPLAWLQQELTADDGTGGDNLGYSVAVSGTAALVGALQATVNGNQYQGAAYIFTKSDGIWTEQQKLIASDGGGSDNFGKSVALDGTTALIGAHGATVNGHRYQGAVYVFTLSGGRWTEQHKLTASDGAAGDNFGGALALAGTTAIVGAFNAAINGVAQQGAAYVYAESNGTWAQVQKLSANDGAQDDQFGHSIAFDGTSALIGAWGATIDGNYGQGAAYVFAVADGSWSETQKLIASDGAGGDTFSGGLAVSGTTALIGAPDAVINDNWGQGGVYAFTEVDGSWSQTQKLTASDGVAADNFGYAVALDGTTALVGASNATVSDNVGQGAAYLLTDVAGSWSEMQKLTASDGTAYNKFGCAVSLSAGTALVGAEFAPINGNFGQGAAFTFTQDTVFTDGFDGP